MKISYSNFEKLILYTVELFAPPHLQVLFGWKNLHLVLCNYIMSFLFQPYQCTFNVWSRPWLNDTRLTKEECDSIQRFQSEKHFPLEDVQSVTTSTPS